MCVTPFRVHGGLLSFQISDRVNELGGRWRRLCDYLCNGKSRFVGLIGCLLDTISLIMINETSASVKTRLTIDSIAPPPEILLFDYFFMKPDIVRKRPCFCVLYQRQEGGVCMKQGNLYCDTAQCCSQQLNLTRRQRCGDWTVQR